MSKLSGNSLIESFKAENNIRAIKLFYFYKKKFRPEESYI